MMLCGHRSVLQPEQPPLTRSSLFSHAAPFVLEVLKVSHISCLLSWNGFRSGCTEETELITFFSTYILVNLSFVPGSDCVESLGSSSWLWIQLWSEGGLLHSSPLQCCKEQQNQEYYHFSQSLSFFIFFGWESILPYFEFEESVITCVSRSRASSCAGDILLEYYAFDSSTAEFVAATLIWTCVNLPSLRTDSKISPQ